MGSPLKRGASSSSSKGELCPQTNEAAVGKIFTTDDALSYLRAIKVTYQGNKDKYDRFLKITKDFKDHRIDPTVVIARVKELFKKNPSLILGFNTFLPKEYGITLPIEYGIVQRKSVEYEDANNFVNKIKTWVQNDDRVYKQFVEILNLYRKGSKTVTEVYQEMKGLCGNHPKIMTGLDGILMGCEETGNCCAFVLSLLVLFLKFSPRRVPCRGDELKQTLPAAASSAGLVPGPFQGFSRGSSQFEFPFLGGDFLIPCVMMEVHLEQ